MIEIKDMKEYCIEKINTMVSRDPLLDIFYLIIKAQGKSYKQIRSTWIKAQGQQTELFKEI